MTGKDVATAQDRDAVQMEALSRKLDEMIATVPGDEGDALISMIDALITADRIDDLDAPWRNEGMEDYLNQPLNVVSIKKVPSDIADGPGWFLVVSAVQAESGEVVSVTTSSVMIMVSLILAHNRGWLPHIFIPRQASKPTKNGYYPMHLEVYRAPKANPNASRAAEATERVIRQREEAAARRAAAAPEPEPATARRGPAPDAGEVPGF